jgi:hypothetical protein
MCGVNSIHPRYGIFTPMTRISAVSAALTSAEVQRQPCRSGRFTVSKSSAYPVGLQRISKPDYRLIVHRSHAKTLRL